MDVDLAPILFVLMVSTTAVQSQIKGPMNALKKVGDSVTLECVTSSKNCEEVEWKKIEGAQSSRNVYTNGIGILNGFPSERYSVNSTGGCNLIITQLKISDSGRFSCVLLMGDREEQRGSVLVVISVTESCLSNVTSNALNENDVYSLSTSINVPAKSVEPSNVILSFHNITANETETMDDSQPLIVRSTLTGIARMKSITSRVCRASLPPNTAPNFDTTTAALNVCTTQQLIVSYPVENIAVSPSSGPYCKNDTVRCTADGHPSPTFEWTHLKSGKVVDGAILVITGEVGDQYTCTATSTIKGKTTSLNTTIEVACPEPGPDCGLGCIIGIVVGGVAVIVAIMVTFFVSKRVRNSAKSLL